MLIIGVDVLRIWCVLCAIGSHRRETVMSNQWSEVLTSAQLTERREMIEKIDPRFAAAQHEWYLRQSAAKLSAMVTGAWYANDPDGYQLARSYLARIIQ